MDIVRALVSIDRFQVGHMPHRVVLDENSVCAQKSPGLAGDVAGHIDVGAFSQGDLLRCHRARVLEPAELDAQKLALGDVGQHVGESDLLDLLSADRLAEHQALLRVTPGFVEAGHSGADRAERDPETRLGETLERALQPAGLRQEGAVGQADILQMKLTRVGRQQRHFALLVSG